MKKLLLSLLVVALMCGLILGGCSEPSPSPAPSPAPAPAPTPAPAPGEKVILRVAMPQPPTSPMAPYMNELAERFNGRDVGGYEVQVFPGQQLVKAGEQLTACRAGTIEINMAGWAMFAGQEPVFGAVEMPFLYNNVEAIAAASNEQMDLLAPLMEEKWNQKALASFNVQALEPLAKKPLKTVEDWEGVLMQSIAPPCNMVIDAFGASSVAIPFPDTYPSLEKGVVDGTFGAPSSYLTLKLYEVATYCTLGCIVPTTQGYTINLDVWNEMPKQTQDILVEEFTKTADILNQFMVDYYHELAEDLLPDAGIEVYMLPGAEREKWHALVQPSVDEYLSNLGEYGKQLQQLSARINKEYPNK